MAYSSGRSVNYQNEQVLRRERDALGRFVKTIESKSYEILLEESARLKREAYQQTPKDSGDLRNSIKVEARRGSTSKTKVVLDASASSVHRGYDYAGIQHDNPSFKHAPGTNYKFIEKPFYDALARIERRIEEELTIDR